MNITDDTRSDVCDALRSQAARVESTAPPLDEIIQRAHHPAPLALVRQGRPRLRVGLAIGLAALATGGAVAAIGNSWPRAADYRAVDRSPELSSAVGDKQVTLEEYKAGFDRYRQCEAAAGQPLQDVIFDQSTSLYSASGTGSEYDEECYVREFYALDVAWQLDPNRPGYVASPPAIELLTEACRANGPVSGFPYSGEQLRELCDRLDQGPPTGG